MNTLIVTFFAVLALTSAAPSGLGLGLGLGGLGGLGLAGPGAILTAPSASAVIAGPAGIAGIAAPGLLGAGVITRGGGVVGVGPLGATVRGPPTAPAVISGPSGTVVASGLWGPTLAGVAGHSW